MAYNKYAKLETLNNKDSQFNFIKLFASGYNRGRIISLIVFPKSVAISVMKEKSCRKLTRKVYSTVPCIARYAASFLFLKLNALTNPVSRILLGVAL